MNSKRTAGESYWSCYRRARKRSEFDLQLLLEQRQLDNDSSSETESQQDDGEEHEATETIEANTSIAASHNNHGICDCDEFASEILSSDNSWSDSESTSSSDTISYSDSNEPHSLTEQLAVWATECNIPGVATTRLLHILKRYHPFLPSDSRSLQHTCRKYDVKKLENGGEYYHFGLSNCLNQHVSESLTSVTELHLQFNVDGLPLFKSSNAQFWPILCKIREFVDRPPVIIGIYSGTSKPPVTFVQEFVDELKSLLDNGLYIQDHKIQVFVDNFVCDAPARSFLKCIKSHSGYSSCERCVQPGEWKGKVVFSEIDAPLRTDDDFCRKVDEKHHSQQQSPLENLGVGMVSQFVLDPMHLLYLGVARRLLLAWIRGSYSVRLSQQICSQLSSVLLNMSTFIPREFSRRPRSLLEIDRWKATEFRLFLLYTGPIAIRKFVTEAVYKHFMLLSVASYILSSSDLCVTYCDYAEKLLTMFVSEVGKIYGKDMLVYNIHCLLHLCDDVRHYGCLENFSAFIFENKLKSIKQLIRKPNRLLQQVIRRLSEQQAVPDKCHKISDSDVLKCAAYHEHSRWPVPEGYEDAKQYRQLSINSLRVSLKRSDSCILTTDNSLCIVTNVLLSHSQFILVVRRFTKVYNFFEYPLPSTSLGIMRTSLLHLSHHETVILPEDASKKCMILPYDDSENEVVVVPLLHCS